ncbi:MAG: hypothetical protein JST09_10320 [Bacteroidetes bacterium]|nr:hypothetical protein [Bacteroidota bacterium]
MTTNLVVDDQNELQEKRMTGRPAQPAALRVLAKIISYIFHPLFIPVYLIWFYVKSQPHLFSGFTPQERNFLIIRFGVMYTFFPLFTILLLKALKFVKSVYLQTQQERVIPYIICMVYYWWMWYVLHNQPEFAGDIVKLALAIFIASILGLMANIIMKVSMHAMSVGVAATFLIMMGFSQDVNFSVYISIGLLITGLVCTSRLIVSDHTSQEIYMGLFIGIISQAFAYSRIATYLFG